MDRLRDSLRQTLIQADKLVLSSREAASRSRMAVEEEKALEPRLDMLRGHTLCMQRQMEQDLSSRYKGRQVNVMGEINMI